MRTTLLVAVLVAGSGTVAHAQQFEVLGTRALGMAGAFVAVADDATAAYWNPAGLPTGHFFSLLADHTDSEQRQIAGRVPAAPASDLGGTIVALSTNEIAFSYYRLHINQIDAQSTPGATLPPGREDQGGETILRSVHTHNLAVTGAQLVYPGVSLGTSLRYVYGSAGVGRSSPGLSVAGLLDQAAGVTRTGQSAFDLDLGVMLGSDTIRFGLTARNLLQPSFDTPDGGSLRLDRQVRAGLAVRAAGGLLIAADADLTRTTHASRDVARRNVALGAEHWFGHWLAVRGGGRVNVEADEPRAVGAFGISMMLMSGVYLDGQITRGRDSIERGWSVAARVGF